MERPVSAIDLFCGAGGLTHGFILEGIKVRAGIDVDPTCEYPFQHNNNSKFIEKDISDITADEIKPYFSKGEVRLLAGCAPCQPFSTYSQGHRNDNDNRWSLLYQFARLAEELHPEILTMENVPKLAEHQVFKDFVVKLEKLGYHVNHQIVDCRYYGVPQSRKRLVMFASKYGLVELVPTTHSEMSFVTVKKVIGKIEKLAAGESSRRDPLHRTSRLSEKNLERVRVSMPGGTWRDWSEELRTDCHKKRSGKSYPGVYGRMSWDELAPTITTQFYGFGNGRFGHPEQDRAISLREAALIQTFPKTYAFVPPKQPVHIKKIGRLIGNAVPVQLARIIARSILRHLANHKI